MHFGMNNSGTQSTLNMPSEPYYLQLTFEGKIYALSLQATLEQLSPIHVLEWAYWVWIEQFPQGSAGVSESISLNTRGIFHWSFSHLKRINEHGGGHRGWAIKSCFLGLSCSMSLSANQLGYKENCIIFTQPAKDGWWLFSMEKGSISLTLSKIFH